MSHLLILDGALDGLQSFCIHTSFDVFPGEASLSWDVMPPDYPSALHCLGPTSPESLYGSATSPSFWVADALLMVDDVVGGQQIIVRCPKSTGNDTVMHIDS